MSACWWCCHAYEGDPLHLPFKYDDRTKKFKTMGYFCSWGCMKAFNLDRNGINKGGIVAANISLMRKQIYNKLTPIKCAPDRFALKMFGGKYEIEEFRNFSEGENFSPIVNIPDKPHNFVSVGFVETVFEKAEYESASESKLSGKMKNINAATASTDSLKLKRNKPLKRDVSNLENIMGITRHTAKK